MPKTKPFKPIVFLSLFVAVAWIGFAIFVPHPARGEFIVGSAKITKTDLTGRPEYIITWDAVTPKFAACSFSCYSVDRIKKTLTIQSFYMNRLPSLADYAEDPHCLRIDRVQLHGEDYTVLMQTREGTKAIGMLSGK